MDGKAYLAVANGLTYDVSLLLSNGDGSFQLAQNFSLGIFARAIAIGDFNGDGKPDLTVANLNSNSVSILINPTPSR